MKISVSLSHILKADNIIRTFEAYSSKIMYQYDGIKVKIFSIRTKTSEQGKGSARQALIEFLDMVDELHVPVYLDSSPLNKKTNWKRLYTFYTSMGFKPTGKTVNPMGDPEMMRHAN